MKSSDISGAFEDISHNTRVGILFVGVILIGTIICLILCLICKLCESTYCKTICRQKPETETDTDPETPEAQHCRSGLGLGGERILPGSDSYWNQMDVRQAGNQLCLNCGGSQHDEVSKTCVVVDEHNDSTGIIKVPLLRTAY